MVRRPKFPDGLEVRGELGKGSNNRVLRVSFKGNTDSYVMRVPRRRSDTQQRHSAVWEFRHTLMASQLGVGPLVYDAWCAKHAYGSWPSGLYVITERVPYELEAVLMEKPEMREEVLTKGGKIGASIVQCLQTLADSLIFVYDLKPSNVMVRFTEDGEVTVRVIDFGRDFCEWAGKEDDPDSKTPVVSGLRKMVAARGDDEDVDAVVKHVLFAAMMVVMSATTTRRIHDERHDHRMHAEERKAVHPLSSLCASLLDGMQGRNLRLLRWVLRNDEVKGVLRHYHGRRDAGTKRTMRLARGVEV